MKLDFTEEASQTLYNEFTSHKELLEEALPLTDMQHLEFKNLEWRFETQVSSAISFHDERISENIIFLGCFKSYEKSTGTKNTPQV